MLEEGSGAGTMTRLRQTHTFSTLEVSAIAYDEIATLLRNAGYTHVFIDGAIDMNGIGLVRGKPVCKCKSKLLLEVFGHDIDCPCNPSNM